MVSGQQRFWSGDEETQQLDREWTVWEDKKHGEKINTVRYVVKEKLNEGRKECKARLFHE